MRSIFGLLFIVCQTSCLTYAQEILFKKKEIKVNHAKILVEVAETPIQHERGLMFRKKIEPNTGMLFIFKNEEIRSFWMKNTFLPLSIGYFNSQKKLTEFYEMTAIKSEMEQPSVYPSKYPAMYALEMPSGWYKKNKIKVGDRLDLGK